MGGDERLRREPFGRTTVEIDRATSELIDSLVGSHGRNKGEVVRRGVEALVSKAAPLPSERAHA